MLNYDFLKKLVAIDSPSGFTDQACDFIYESLCALGYSPEYTAKGAVRCCLSDSAPRLALAAHVDTLGGVVSGFCKDGNLRFSAVGSLSLNDAEGEYVRIHTLEGKILTGTILLDNPAKHANNQLGTIVRTTENLHIRLDEEVTKAADSRALGIRPGDFVCLEPGYQELPSGFLKSRFMDNKAGCLVLFEIARRFADAAEKPDVELFFSNYEEVGHGASGGFSPSVTELLVIDMGVIGEQCEGSELCCSVCAKDSSGPYDFRMKKQLVNLAEAGNIPYRLDVYPYYGSDGSAALRAGGQFRTGLIGPGVSASHGSERTHKKGVEATVDLCEAYIRKFSI